MESRERSDQGRHTGTGAPRLDPSRDDAGDCAASASQLSSRSGGGHAAFRARFAGAMAAASALVAFATPAVAADLGAVRAVVAPPLPLPPPPAWSGLYVGLDAGWIGGGSREASTLGYSVYDWASGALGMPFGFSAPYVTGVASLEQSGFIGGAQLGYNYLLPSRVLIGVETDFGGSTLTGSGSSDGFASQLDAHGLLHLQSGRAEPSGREIRCAPSRLR
jgi:hypothetical protein